MSDLKRIKGVKVPSTVDPDPLLRSDRAMELEA